MTAYERHYSSYDGTPPIDTSSSGGTYAPIYNVSISIKQKVAFPHKRPDYLQLIQNRRNCQAESATVTATSKAPTTFESSSRSWRASSTLLSRASSLHSASATLPAVVPRSHTNSCRQDASRIDSDTVMTTGGGVLTTVPGMGVLPPAAGPGSGLSTPTGRPTFSRPSD